MPLILAIEPDRRQASQLTAIVRGRLRAELVLAESVDRALAALGDRVPDLILTSALLSPKDDAALGERLRALGSAAAHVQTLTTPLLAAPGRHRTRPTSRGVLSALRRERAKPSAHEGCDPAVFAEQCKEYLEGAGAERLVQSNHHAPQPPIETPSIENSPVLEASEAPVSETSAFVETSPVIEASAVVETSVAETTPVIEANDVISAPLTTAAPPAADRPSLVIDRALVEVKPPLIETAPLSLIAAVAALEAFESETAESPASIDESRGEERSHDEIESPTEAARLDSEDAALELDLTALFDEAAEESPALQRVEGDEPVVYEIDGTCLNVPIEDVMMEEMTVETLRAASLETVEIPQLSEARDEERDKELGRDREDDRRAEPEPLPVTLSETELYTPLRAAHWPALESHAAEFKVPVVEYTSGSDSDESPDESREWRDIIEALRRDAEQVKLARSESTRREPQRKKRRRRMRSPVQDEWGFFDPQQCGFAALLAKLEEITDKEDTPATPRGA